MNETNHQLLSQLRIDADQRDQGDDRKVWLWVGLAAVLLLTAGAGWMLFTQRAVLVNTALAQDLPKQTGSMTVLDASGYVTARREATVSSKITGRLSEVLIEEGEHVDKGQILARLDDTDAQAQVALAQAQLAAVKAQSGELDTQLQQAQRDLQRQRDLNTKGLGTTQALDDATTRVATLQAQLAVQRKQIDVAQAQLNIANVNLDNCIIRAPFAGVITDKAAQPGEIVSPISAGGGFTRTGIGTIVDMDSLEIEVDVNESFINRVKPGQPVEAVLDAYPDWKIPGSVIAIIPTADRAKATIRVRIAIDTKDPRLVPDMGVRVSFLEQASQTRQAERNGVLVPGSAVLTRDGKSLVYVVQQDQAKQRAVVTGQTFGDLRLIQSGLHSGEQVVVDPPPDLANGSHVKVKKDSEQ